MKTAIAPDSKFEGSAPTAKKLTVHEDRNIATLAHFGGFLGCIPSGIIFYLYRGRGPFTEQESREAFNFTLLPTLVIVVSMFLASLPAVGWLFGLIAALLWAYIAFMSLVAGIKTNKGNPYQYRLNTALFDKLSARKK
ncbi:DUF4870 domain-containing protein [Rothia aerolata]|uniref:DUF4870 domain-containing protein n=1 Tax=Rothia aerolata TaxID=1812262 RepID=A0A917IL27_9MICC|nr:DUF4870 domain-containing protein [Rothia aerolata]GGH57636.1 hypothetical protein GCM10007359_02980 [Rothia aerolata]